MGKGFEHKPIDYSKYLKYKPIGTMRCPRCGCDEKQTIDCPSNCNLKGVSHEHFKCLRCGEKYFFSTLETEEEELERLLELAGIKKKVSKKRKSSFNPSIRR